MWALYSTLRRNPKILIFDDSFSALDYKTDRILRDRITTELKGGTTCLRVVQRIGTIRNTDKFAVRDGRVALDIGTHDELF